MSDEFITNSSGTDGDSSTGVQDTYCAAEWEQVLE